MKIKSISIKNFKGIKDFKYDFDKKMNELNGSNGSGKTSIKEAYFWCLGQDIKNIIPSKDNVEIPNLQIEVELKIEIDDVEFVLSRKQVEKYKEDKESGKKVKTGNESTFYIDGIECKLVEFKEKVAGMLKIQDYNTFLLLSDIEFFNGTTNSWKWQNRRSELLKHINYDNAVILNRDAYRIIKDDIMKGYALDELKKSYKKFNADLDKEKEKNLIIIEQLESQNLNNTDDTSSYLKEMKLLEEKKKEYYESLNEYREVANDYNNFTNKLININNNIDMLESTLKSKKNSSRKELDRINEQIDTLTNSEKKHCPYCDSELQDDSLKGLIDKLNSQKLELIENAKKEINELSSKIEKLQGSKMDLDFKINSIKEEFNIDDINSKLNDNSYIQNLDNQIMQIKSKVLQAQTILENQNKIENLNKQNLDLTARSIEYVNKLNALNDYNVEISKYITKMVNDLFPSEVTFALFDFANYKGDLEDVCVSMLNGKTYDECSTGEKYYLNFLITTTLQKLYNVELPLWCDNYECLSRNLDCNSQLITLSVSGVNDNNINKIIKL